MGKIKNINLSKIDYHKLGKYKQVRCGNIRIRISDIPTKEVKVFGRT